MKKLKLIALSSICIIAIFSVTTMVSCKKPNNIVEPTSTITKNTRTGSTINEILSVDNDDDMDILSQIKPFNRDFTITNNEGSIKLNISSNSEEFLNDYLNKVEYNFQVLYTHENTVDEPLLENVPENAGDVQGVTDNNSTTTTLVTTNIPENAIGVKIILKNRVRSAGYYYGAESGFAGMERINTLSNKIVVCYSNNNTANNNVLYIEKWAKKYSTSSWAFKGDGYLGQYPMNNGCMPFCIKNFKRIESQVNYNYPATYTYSIYGTSTCP